MKLVPALEILLAKFATSIVTLAASIVEPLVLLKSFAVTVKLSALITE